MNQFATGRRDNGEREILQTCEAAGYLPFAKVKDPRAVKGWYIPARIGQGCDVFLCGPFGVVFVENKDGKKPPSARKLTDDETKMMELCESFGIEYWVIESPEDMAALIAELEAK